MTSSLKESPPTKFGVILFPEFEVLDVFGPLEALNVLRRPDLGALYQPFSLSMIAASLCPVSSMPHFGEGPQFTQTVVPTHTLENAPRDIEVLLIPGGLGTRDKAGTQGIVSFIVERYPRLRYLITVCTGADLAARAGVLDGKRATTNKAAWSQITAKESSSAVCWVAHARWVVDGNIWTTSGVSAGTDGMIAFIAQVYGEETAAKIVVWMEYIRNSSSEFDPFADLYKCEDVPPRKELRI